jgi:hypothetical protein
MSELTSEGVCPCPVLPPASSDSLLSGLMEMVSLSSEGPLTGGHDQRDSGQLEGRSRSRRFDPAHDVSSSARAHIAIYEVEHVLLSEISGESVASSAMM